MIHSLANCLGGSDPFPVENQIMVCPVCLEWTKTIKTLNKFSNKYEYTQYLIKDDPSKLLANSEGQEFDPTEPTGFKEP